MMMQGMHPMSMMMMGQAMMGMGATEASLAQVVRSGQRSSNNWKTAWAAYVQLYGNGYNDPNKYQPEFLADFLEYLGELGMGDLAMKQPDAAALESRKRAASETYVRTTGPPSKRINA